MLDAHGRNLVARLAKNLKTIAVEREDLARLRNGLGFVDDEAGNGSSGKLHDM